MVAGGVTGVTGDPSLLQEENAMHSKAAANNDLIVKIE
jgi:hypothetical protein